MSATGRASRRFADIAYTFRGAQRFGRFATWDWPRLARHGFILGAGIYVVAVAAGLAWYGSDAPIWWASRLPDPYAFTVYADGQPGFFYSPAFALAVAPFQWLPEPVFVALWTALLFAALYAMTGRYAIAALVFPPVALDIATGNVHVLFALVAVFGLRYPALWAFPLLTKVTPGIGLVWFAVRKEWPQLAVSLGVAAAIVGVSFLLTPGAWFEWVGLLLGNVGAEVNYPHVPIPWPSRFLFALLLVAWGALTDRRWTVPVSMMLALPVIWPGSFALLVAVPFLRR